MSEANLTAQTEWESPDDFATGEMGRAVVVVYFGDVEVARLVPIRESKASKGDDSTYFMAEEIAICAETVAPLLQHLFNKAAEELGYE